jgi:hypothetical protein
MVPAVCCAYFTSQTADGAIKVVDRKKNIFKLSHGDLGSREG